MAGAEATPFQTEAWTEYGVGVLVLFLRYFARWKTVGFKGWQSDDWFAVACLFFWTSELAMLELIGQNGTNIGVTDDIGRTLPADEIARREFGSKCLLAGWNLYVTLIWCLKGTCLCFYERMTLGLWQQKVVKWTQLGTGLAYIVIICIIWGHCTPVQMNWQVYPNPGDRCTLAVANYIGLVVLNIATDMVIVMIPVPLLWKVKLNIKRKLLIGVLLCSGVFIMIATLLRCIMSLRDIQGINVSTIWAIRETFVGILAVNAAPIKPLFSKSRWLASSKGSSANKPSGYNNNSGYNSSKYGHALGNMPSATGVGGSRQHHSHHGMTRLGDNSSEEHIVKDQDFNHYKSDVRAGSTTSDRSSSNNPFQAGIVVTKTYEVAPVKSTLDV